MRWKLILGFSCYVLPWSMAYAQCQLTPAGAPANFGTTSSFSFIGKSFETSSSNSGLNCQIPILTLLHKNVVYATYRTTNNANLVSMSSTSADEKINYELYYDPQRTKPILLNVKNDLSSLKILDLLGLLGGNKKEPIPIYFKIPPQNLNLTAGEYKDRLMIEWEWDICPGISALGICLGRDQGAGTALIDVNLIITKDCKISANDINFGSAPLVSMFDDVTGSINIICTKGTTYTVGLSDGDNFSGTRRMASGGNYIAYDVYKGSTANVRWGKNGGERRHSNGAEENAGAGWGGPRHKFFVTLLK